MIFFNILTLGNNKVVTKLPLSSFFRHVYQTSKRNFISSKIRSMICLKFHYNQANPKTINVIENTITSVNITLRFDQSHLLILTILTILISNLNYA